MWNSQGLAEACRDRTRTLQNMPRMLQSMPRTLQSMPRLAKDIAKHAQELQNKSIHLRFPQISFGIFFLYIQYRDDSILLPTIQDLLDLEHLCLNLCFFNFLNFFFESLISQILNFYCILLVIFSNWFRFCEIMPC